MVCVCHLRPVDSPPTLVAALPHLLGHLLFCKQSSGVSFQSNFRTVHKSFGVNWCDRWSQLWAFASVGCFMSAQAHDARPDTRIILSGKMLRFARACTSTFCQGGTHRVQGGLAGD